VENTDDITITMSRKDAKNCIAYMRSWGADFMFEWNRRLCDQLAEKLKTPKRRKGTD